jgi:hypothetical protein
MNLDQLKSARAIAGANYAAVVAAFHDALIELAAIDQLLGVPSFGPLPDPVQFRHPVYAADVGGHWQTDIADRRDQINREGSV